MKKLFFLLAIALQIFIGKSSLVAVVYPGGGSEVVEEKATLCYYEICIKDLGNGIIEEGNNYSLSRIYDDGMNPEIDVIEEKEERVCTPNKKKAGLGKLGNGSTSNIEEEGQSVTFYEIYTSTKKDVSSSDVCDRPGTSGEDFTDEKNSLCFFGMLER